MRILVSNDDGISAQGILALVRALRDLGEVVVVAPDRQRSASSHGISIHRRLIPTEVDLGMDNVRAFSLSGTPVDCVKFGIHEFGRSESFDLMVSGINEGRNLATDVLYSGTVAAAGEAALQGVPAMAVSLDGPPFPFEDAASVVRNMVTRLRFRELDADTFLSVNIPAGAVDGPWVVSRIGAEGYRDRFIRHVDEEGQVYYRYAGDVVRNSEDEDADTRVIASGCVSITPLRYRFTNEAAMDTLKTWF
ncbi:5'/3'-nucleotidase SurE [Alicyclobacillus mengziensis]|uniref:5'-nucleotidase SurE n=1 Tax=Alicyclobacillus mengziensis TaxID=2931921 RepID=A0A9X7VV50_9BACL|nr:5'/3'-nucleotidase SurE [Alicyclobacillus mengziensis]QSO45688.1 5'/3'-nucleotidase SurE [Alicyclobacillus mengziensis]